MGLVHWLVTFGAERATENAGAACWAFDEAQRTVDALELRLGRKDRVPQFALEDLPRRVAG